MFYENDYAFDSEKRYLIYFRGCFEPPHKGHFSLIEKFINEPNVEYFLHQMPHGKRHGIPYWLKRKIWKIYISELLPKEKIKLKKMGHSLDILEYVDDIDVVILIRGNEGLNEFDKKNMRKRYRFLRRELRKMGKTLDFLLLDRPELNTLSATKFMENIKARKSCRAFVPDELSEKSYKYIISQIRKNISK